jgi:hypothetical protein
MHTEVKFFEGLSDVTIKELVDQSRPVNLKSGESVEYNPDGTTDQIIFPINAVCALTAVTENAEPVCLPLFGSEAFIGSSIKTDRAQKSKIRSIVVVGGLGLAIPTGRFTHLFLKYNDINIERVAMVVRLLSATGAEGACSAAHSPTQRIAERIAKISSILRTDDFSVTGGMLAKAANCSRSSVQRAFADLKALEAVAQDDGRVSIVSHAALESVACGCSRLPHELEQVGQLTLPMGGQHDNVLSFRR